MAQGDVHLGYRYCDATGIVHLSLLQMWDGADTRVPVPYSRSPWTTLCCRQGQYFRGGNTPWWLFTHFSQASAFHLQPMQPFSWGCEVSPKQGCTINKGAHRVPRAASHLRPLRYRPGVSYGLYLHLICLLFVCVCLQPAWDWGTVVFAFPTLTQFCSKGHGFCENCCSRAVILYSQAAGSLNSNFLITFFPAVKLSGSITCFLLLFLLKFVINSLTMWKESREASTVTQGPGHCRARLSIRVHQHFSRTESPILVVSASLFLKTPLCSHYYFFLVSPAGLIFHQYVLIHPIPHFPPCRAGGSGTCSPPASRGSRFTSHLSAKISSLFTNTLDLPDGPCLAFHVLCMANSTDLCLDL